MLKGEDGVMLAVLPASSHIQFGQLREQPKADVDMANEEQIETLFVDCDPGAVPALGTAYAFKVILDDSLASEPEIHLDGGDHASQVVHISGSTFQQLIPVPGMRGSPKLPKRCLRKETGRLTNATALHYVSRKETLRMAKRKQLRSSNRTRRSKTPIANGSAAPARTISKPPLTEPFHVAVDRQFKSGHETYEAAEKVALGIKKRYPKLYVTIFDTKEQRHTIIEQPEPAGGSNNNRRAEQATRNAAEQLKVVAGSKHSLTLLPSERSEDDPAHQPR